MFESMNARQGIKTGSSTTGLPCPTEQFESMNARQGIKTRSVSDSGDRTTVRLNQWMPDRALRRYRGTCETFRGTGFESMNARQGIKTDNVIDNLIWYHNCLNQWMPDRALRLFHRIFHHFRCFRFESMNARQGIKTQLGEAVGGGKNWVWINECPTGH